MNQSQFNFKNLNEHHRKRWKIIIPALVVVLLAVGTGIYFAAVKHLIVLGQSGPSLPKGWTTQYSQNCNADLPLPPNQSPYQQKTAQGTRYWQKEEYSSQQDGSSSTIDRVIFKYPGEQGTLVSGVVILYCSPNKAKDTTSSYVAKFEKSMSTDPRFKGVTVQSKATKTYWNRQVVQFIATAPNGDVGEYFFFATPEHIYLVRPQSQVKDQTIRNTTKQIFLDLYFFDQD